MAFAYGFMKDEIVLTEDSKPLITNIYINYQPADFGQSESPLEQSILHTKKITLPYNKNTLGFEIDGLKSDSFGFISFAFMLVGYDNDWITYSQNRFIQYTKLPPGKYILKVKTLGYEVPSTQLDIHIQQPWWMSFWAMGLYILSSMFIILIIVLLLIKRRKAKLRIQQNNMEIDKIKEIDLIKSRFYSNVSHELRTPLTLIMGPIGHLLKKATDKSDRSTLLMIQKNARQLQQFINEVLELSKLEADKFRLQVEETGVVHIVRDRIQTVKKQAQKKGITIDLVSTHKELLCYLDPDKFKSIVSNLLSNALKFTPKGGRIGISISGCSGNKHDHCTHKEGCVILSVKDNGIGISQEKLPFIFDKYYQGDPGKSGEDSGTGLGLALVKEMVSLHKGTINVESKVGEFTEFVIRFPFGQNNLKPDDLFYSCDIEIPIGRKIDSGENVFVEADSILSDLDSKVILVVEDNEAMRKVICSGLQEYEIIEAKDGQEGAQLAVETCPDLILCDVIMPNKNGFEVTKSLKSNEITSHIPIIILTAKDALSDKLTGLRIGADDYLIKPFFIKELKARVKNLITQREKLKDKYSTSKILKLSKVSNKSIDQVFLEKTINIIEANLIEESFGVHVILSEMNISRTQLHRKLKAIIGQSANELIQSIRLQKASEMLKNKSATISEIGYLVGFSGPSSFSRAFKQYFGHAPSEHV